MTVKILRMPFGKYEGCALADLDLEYLLWLLDVKIRSPQLRRGLEEEYQRRIDTNVRAAFGWVAEQAGTGQTLGEEVRWRLRRSVCDGHDGTGE